jgi:hypothetical protein
MLAKLFDGYRCGGNWFNDQRINWLELGWQDNATRLLEVFTWLLADIYLLM